MSDSNVVSDQNQTNSVQSDVQTNDKVAYDTYRRVLSEAKKLKEQLKAFEEEKVKSHEQKLKEQNEWKALAEAKTAQAEQLEKLYKEQNEQIVNGMKYQEFEKHLGGKLKNKDYATFIDFDKIVMNPETRRIDDESVKGVVSNFVKNHSHLVEFYNGAKMPNEASKSASFSGKAPNEMSIDEIKNELKKIGKI
jgi:hypothetical protein